MLNKQSWSHQEVAFQLGVRIRYAISLQCTKPACAVMLKFQTWTKFFGTNYTMKEGLRKSGFEGVDWTGLEWSPDAGYCEDVNECSDVSTVLFLRIQCLLGCDTFGVSLFVFRRNVRKLPTVSHPRRPESKWQWNGFNKLSWFVEWLSPS
jgi:hypothetical protein